MSVKASFLLTLPMLTSQARHICVQRLGETMSLQAAHTIESQCFLAAEQVQDKSASSYLQHIHRLTSNAQECAALLLMNPSLQDVDLFALDHKSMAGNKQTPYDELLDAKRRLDRALANPSINFDMTSFKSTVRCRYCGKAEFIQVRYEQRRARDEGATRIMTCTACNEQWT